LLAEHHRIDPAYVASSMDFSRKTLDQLLPEGTIYLLGGGNFGSLYPKHQNFRTGLMERYRERVVQLPQSIFFATDSSLTSARSLGATGAKIMVRDHPSETLACKIGFEPLLVPDFAFGMGAQAIRQSPDRDLMVLKRTDSESRGPTISGMDWAGDVPFSSLAVAFQTAMSEDGFSKLAYFDRLAHRRCEHGFRLLSHGRVVATDRLHGHILALILGLPHFVSNNTTGKLGAFVEAWTSGSPHVHAVPDLADLTRLDIARMLQ